MNVRWLAAVLAFGAGPAAASCSWDWLCNGEGACKQMPVCDSVYETPPPRPESAPPTPPPLAMRPFKIARHMTGLTCEHIMRQSQSGHWSWDEACFCQDQTKAKDPSTPFANIVRCEPPWKDDKAAAPAAPTGTAPSKSSATASASNAKP